MYGWKLWGADEDGRHGRPLEHVVKCVMVLLLLLLVLVLLPLLMLPLLLLLVLVSVCQQQA